MVIYKTTNLLTGKFYVGKDKYSNPKYLGSGKLLHLAFDKYGKENFKKEILCEAKTVSELDKLEIFWIKELNALTPNGYNIAKGGEGGDTMSNHPNKEEIFRKHSIYMKEHTSFKNQTKETRAKIGKLLHEKYSGENSHMFGRNLDEGAKRKISEANKGRSHSNETKKKISESNKGKPGSWKGKKNKKHSNWMKENNPFKDKKHSDESKFKMSNKLKGKPKSREHKKKLSNSLKGNIPSNRIKIEINGEVYKCIGEASKKLGINYSTLRNRIKSKNILYVNYKKYE